MAVIAPRVAVGQPPGILLFVSRPAALLMLLSLSYGCGGPIPSSDTPASPPTPTGESPQDAAYVSAPAVHTLTITLCSRDSRSCRLAQPGDAPLLGYRVSFGGSVGTLRSREQALADLYRELRDRTGFGTRLAAAAHHVEQTLVDAAIVEPGAPARPSTSGQDPLVEAAFDIMEAVDTEGRVTVDVAHGGTTCKVSFAAHDSDAGSGRCLVKGPARPGMHDDEGVREPKKVFGR